MAKQTQMSTVEFLRVMYQGVTGGFVELRAIPVKKGIKKERRAFVQSPKEVDAFIKQFGGRGSEYGVYFGVAKRTSEAGKKENCAPLTCLWADVDTEKNGWNTDEVLKEIGNLKGPLAPNMIVKSGGGLHLYWLLDKPEANHGLIETTNKRLAQVFSGDNVHDVSRILRLPGSFNNKRKPTLCEVVYCFHFERRSFDEVQNAADAVQHVFTGAKWEKETVVLKREAKNTFDPYDKYAHILAGGNRDVAKNLDKYWRDNVRYNAPRGYVGVHEAQLVTTARLHCAGIEPDTIVRHTLNYTRDRMTQDAPEEFATWNIAEEEKNIRGMLQSFLPKWAAMKKEYRASKRAAKV